MQLNNTNHYLRTKIGRFLVGGSVVFKGKCNNNDIMVRIDGTLVATSNYSVIGNEGSWLLFDDVDGVSIIGGVLDGQGTSLWDCKKSDKSCPTGATVWIIFLKIC